MQSKVSVIIPVYNTKAYLEECVRSVIEQTYSNIEVLLMGDSLSLPTCFGGGYYSGD